MWPRRLQVSSKAIAEKMPGKIRSATIRNELADLVKWGIWSSPTPPPGGSPPPRATGSTCDELMERRALPEAEAEASRHSLTGQMSQVDQVMARSRARSFSSMVATRLCRDGPHAGGDGAAVRPHCRDDDSFIAVAMLSDSRVKSQLLRWQLPVEREALDGDKPPAEHSLPGLRRR